MRVLRGQPLGICQASTKHFCKGAGEGDMTTDNDTHIDPADPPADVLLKFDRMGFSMAEAKFIINATNGCKKSMTDYCASVLMTRRWCREFGGVVVEDPLAGQI
jgi:hypothetical protein